MRKTFSILTQDYSVLPPFVSLELPTELDILMSTEAPDAECSLWEDRDGNLIVARFFGKHDCWDVWHNV